MAFNLEEFPIPIDRVASRVVYTKDHYKFKNPSNEKCSTTPFPTRPIPKNTPDLTGLKKGSLTVIGLYGGIEVGFKRGLNKNRNKPQGHGWVCKCSCGNYTVRKSKSLKKKCDDACIECTVLRRSRDGFELKIAEKIEP